MRPKHSICPTELKILLNSNSLEGQNISFITRNFNLTYNGVYKEIMELESKGLVMTKKKGRTRYVYFSENAKKIGKLLKEADAIMKESGVELVRQNH